MNKKLFFVFIWMFFATVCRGGTIQWDVVDWYYDNSPFQVDEFVLDINNSVFFYTKLTTSTQQADLNNFRWIRLRYECTLLLTSPGTLINYDLFANADELFYQTSYKFPFKVETSQFIDFSIPKTEDDLSNILTFAFALSKWDNGVAIDYYGWFEIGYDGNEVYILNSAMIDGMWSGIYAGVPEPSTAFLVLSGCAVLLLRRRKLNTKINTGGTP